MRDEDVDAANFHYTRIHRNQWPCADTQYILQYNLGETKGDLDHPEEIRLDGVLDYPHNGRARFNITEGFDLNDIKPCVEALHYVYAGIILRTYLDAATWARMAGRRRR